MDSPELRKEVNKYLQVEFGWDEYPDPEKVSVDYPYKLYYKGLWAIPNDNDPNGVVDVYLVHEEGKSQESNPDLYAYVTRNKGTVVYGADEAKGISIEEYIKSEWEVEPKRLDEEKKE